MYWAQAYSIYPTVRAKVNGSVSKQLSISIGTRQGCLLSPLIFVMSLQPFRSRLRQNSDMVGCLSNRLQILQTIYWYISLNHGYSYPTYKRNLECTMNSKFQLNAKKKIRNVKYLIVPRGIGPS